MNRKARIEKAGNGWIVHLSETRDRPDVLIEKLVFTDWHQVLAKLTEWCQ